MYKKIKIIPFIFFVFILFYSHKSSAESCESAISFVNKVSSAATEIVSSDKYTKPLRKFYFKKLFIDNADFETMGQVALGKYSRKLKPEMKEEYNSLIKKLVIQMIYNRLDTEEQNKYIIVNNGCKLKGSKGIEYLINGDILDSDERKITSITWWVIDKNDSGLKVLDVSIAGISLALQKREEFTSYISKNHNSINALIDNLKKKLN